MARRETCFDTETTGLDPEQDRVVEIAAIELVDLRPTGRRFHALINPGRPMPAEAKAIHGLDDEKLADKPFFPEVAQGFLDFIGSDPIVAHNAPFDVRMLDAELRRAGLAPLRNPVVDTLRMSKAKFGAGSRGSLDSLCQRFGIDLSRRVKHEAMLDTELLAEVYFHLRGGRFLSLDLEQAQGEEGGPGPERPLLPDRGLGEPLPEELERHARFLSGRMKGKHLWPLPAA